jgi:hypothetical protein
MTVLSDFPQSTVLGVKNSKDNLIQTTDTKIWELVTNFKLFFESEKKLWKMTTEVVATIIWEILSNSTVVKRPTSKYTSH